MSNKKTVDVVLACHMNTFWVVCVEDRQGEADKVLQTCIDAATGAKYKLCRGVPCFMAPHVTPTTIGEIKAHVVWKGTDVEKPLRVLIGSSTLEAGESSYETHLRAVKWESQTVKQHKAYLQRRLDIMARNPHGFIDPAEWDAPVPELTVQHDWDNSASVTRSVPRHNGGGVWTNPDPAIKKAVETWSKNVRPASDLGLVVPDPLPPMADFEPWTGEAVPDSPMAYDEDTLHYIDPTSFHHPRASRQRDLPITSASAAQPWSLGLTEKSDYEADDWRAQTFDFAKLKEAYKNL
jgi:hypothetical protein